MLIYIHIHNFYIELSLQVLLGHYSVIIICFIDFQKADKVQVDAYYEVMKRKCH